MLNLEDSQKYESGNLNMNNSEKIKLNELKNEYRELVYIKYKLDYNSEPPFRINKHNVIENLDGTLEILDTLENALFKAGAIQYKGCKEINFKILTKEQKKKLYIRFINRHKSFH